MWILAKTEKAFKIQNYVNGMIEGFSKKLPKYGHPLPNLCYKTYKNHIV